MREFVPDLSLGKATFAHPFAHAREDCLFFLALDPSRNLHRRLALGGGIHLGRGGVVTEAVQQGVRSIGEQLLPRLEESRIVLDLPDSSFIGIHWDSSAPGDLSLISRK